jgi:hypothetical protein
MEYIEKNLRSLLANLHDLQEKIKRIKSPEKINELQIQLEILKKEFKILFPDLDLNVELAFYGLINTNLLDLLKNDVKNWICKKKKNNLFSFDSVESIKSFGMYISYVVCGL